MGLHTLGSDFACRNHVIDIDDEDAICKRTRARYSLASFTLDELETFLQETDDEEDLHKVDDEEEYRKFLTAVLLGGDDDTQTHQENENVDDEDEDNDADFELEIEDALESDLDENIKDMSEEDEYREARRPETRQTKRQKATEIKKMKLLNQANRPLRPLVPIMPIGPYALYNTYNDRSFAPEAGTEYQTFSLQDGSINCITPQQITHLHYLIHEHVQLLLQVFSLAVLDPSQQHAASQVQGLLSELLNKRDQAVAWRNVPHSHITFPLEGRNEYNYSNQIGFSQTIGGVSWSPFIGSPLLSVLDVAPLHQVKTYMDDVKIAKQEYRQRILDDTCYPTLAKEPMFPLTSLPLPAGARTEDSNPTSVDTLPSSSPTHQSSKKTMAATLVDVSKKQFVASVPKEIVKLCQRFFPLFNPALFPRSPPFASAANRVLFTDAEDELLALGLLEYNTDWKAIQQRFLPCKSKHQIFIRQKNRSSSRAPENPIKAVKRKKKSPLTADEVARIHEGLKMFKLDWMCVWKYMVPYRDPSILPRLWRTAIGTQKSYKTDATKKERRRLYESKRRRKAATLPNWKTVPGRENHQTEIPGDNNSEEDSLDNEEEYVHEAFLADWRPPSSSTIRSSEPHHIIYPPNTTGSRESQSQNNTITKFPHTLVNSQHPYNISPHFTHPNASVPPNSKYPKPPIYHLPYRARRSRNPLLVKLAPGLPPVNLPSSARVMPLSAAKNIHPDSSQRVVSKHPGITKSKTTHLIEKGTESDLHMHPLLFESPENGHLPYYPLKYNYNSPSSFSFFTRNQPEISLSLFHNPHLTYPTVNSCTSKETNLPSLGVDFHPLLQRNDYGDGDALASCSTANHTRAKHYSHNDNVKGNSDLDLEIHLSSKSRIDKGIGGEVVGEDNSMRSMVRTVIAESCSMGDGGDQSLQEIVMEQEELSDSDEEIEGDVEFECEEMDDSEGDDGSDCEQSGKTHNMDALNCASGKVSTVAGNDHCTPRKNYTPTLGLTMQRKDTKKSSWLSLDTCATASPAHAENTIHIENSTIKLKNSTVEKLKISRPNRSCKKIAPTDTSAAPHQLSVGPRDIQPVKKPRKRVCRTNLNLNVEVPVESSDCSGFDKA